ncbi:MAG TPA: fibronectin type III domain-containing protein [Melioribacteraceae bacterium]|nr:fibronectin type III domain-containing protein [Melioribacteraceae bacterium]
MNRTLFTFFKILTLFSVFFFYSCEKEETEPVIPFNNPPVIQITELKSDSLLIGTRTEIFFDVKDKENDSIKIDLSAKKGSVQRLTGRNALIYFSPRITGKDTVIINAADGTKQTSEIIELIIGSKPGIPRLLKPENNAVDVNLTVKMSWSRISNSESYDLQISTDPEFLGFVYTRNGIRQNTHTAASLNINTIYYWRVKSRNGFGESPWSTVSAFRTVAPPLAPVLEYPAESERDVSVNPQLIWKRVTNAESYLLQISRDQSFSSILINKTGIRDSLISIENLEYFSEYFWRVASQNSYGTSEWSVPGSFSTTGRPPAAPIDPVPADDALNIPLTAELKWGMVEHTSHYTLQVSSDSLFLDPVFEKDSLISASVSVSGLKNSRKYFWRVKGVNQYGQSEWSATFSFTTLLTNPELSLPLPGTENISPSPEFIWRTVENSDFYTLQVAEDSSFLNPVYEESGISDTAKSIDGLKTFTKFYWRVRAENNITISDWSPVQSFNVSGYFYQGLDYGNQSIYHPAYVLLNGGFDMIQVGNRRDIKNFPYNIAIKNIWKNLSEPFKPISRYGWWNFFKDQVFPLSLNKQNAQFFPNYTLHLIGGGMEYAALDEWFEYNNYPYPELFSAFTVMTYHLINEIAENGNYEGDDVDPIADIYIFDIGGILLFTSNSVRRFFAEDLNLADWSQQPSFSLRNGELHNNGQFFSIKWKFPFLERWYAFYYFGTNGVGGLSYKFDDGSALSVGFGLAASDLILLDEKTNKKTLGLVGNLGVFYDRNNSLLASLSVTIKTDYMINLNIYPGVIKFWDVSPGLWGAYSQDGNVILGFTFSWLPFGFANSTK